MKLFIEQPLAPPGSANKYSDMSSYFKFIYSGIWATWVHLVLFGSTWVHLGSLGFTWDHLCSLGFSWVQLVSLGFRLEALETQCGRMGGGYSTNDENGRRIRMLYDEHKDVI